MPCIEITLDYALLATSWVANARIDSLDIYRFQLKALDEKRIIPNIRNNVEFKRVKAPRSSGRISSMMRSFIIELSSAKIHQQANVNTRDL